MCVDKEKKDRQIIRKRDIIRRPNMRGTLLLTEAQESAASRHSVISSRPPPPRRLRSFRTAISMSFDLNVFAPLDEVNL